jgi:DNA repair protein SbcC/Rad50
VILIEATVEGYGRLVNQRFGFGEGLTVLHGPNESGKTTLADCIVRLLFGYPEHQYSAALDKRRPWKNPATFAATLVYRLDDGRVFETHRDFSTSEVKTTTFERPVMRPVRELTGTRKVSPGTHFFALSLEAFEAAALMRAGDFAEQGDGTTPEALKERIAALVGSAGDSGSAEAITRLDDFVRDLGSERAPTKPIIVARTATAAARSALDEFHRDFERLREDLGRRARLAEERERLSERAGALESRLQRARLASLRARVETAAGAAAVLERAQAKRDEAGAPPAVLARAAALDAAIDEWNGSKSAESDAATTAQSKEDQRNELLRQLSACDATLKEAEAGIKRNTDAIERLRPEAGGATISAEALDKLEALSELTDHQEAGARNKETRAAIARQRPQQGALASLSALAIALIALVAWLVSHLPLLLTGAGIALLAGLLLLAQFVFMRRGRLAADRAREDEASDARAVADNATAALAGKCAELGVADIKAARRAIRVQTDIARFTDALAAARQIGAQALEQRGILEARFNDFDRSDKQLVSARQKAERDGAALAALLDAAGIAGGDLDARVAAFRASRSEIEAAVQAESVLGDARAALAGALGGASIEQLRAEAAALADEIGTAAPIKDEAGDPDALETDLARLRSERHGKEREIERLNGELATFEGRYRGGAAKLEERLAECEAVESALLRARDAASLARGIIDTIKEVVQKNFAPRLNALVVPASADITQGRYTEVSVDPKDFALRARTPESGTIVELSALSTGTQEQLGLSLRAATAQVLGSGEHVPLILDDALAHADERRLVLAVKHLAAISQHQQVLFFTQRDAVLEAARALKDVTIVHLSGPGPAKRT